MAEKTPSSIDTTDTDAPESGVVVADRMGFYEVTPTKRERPKQRFKQTEVGLIPRDWEVMPLGEIGDVRMCKRVLKHQTREHGDVPFFKIGTFGGVPDAFIPQSLFDQFRRKYSFPRKGDILISAAGTIGRTVSYDGAPAYFQDSNIVWIDNDESKATNAYLWHRYQITKWSVSHGGTVARLYNDNLRTKIYLAVPPIPEQQAIATALSDVDGLLGALDRLIAKKCDLKQAAMQELLTGKRRLPGFKKKWETKTLGETLTVRHGKSQKGREKVGGKNPILATGGEIGRTDDYLHSGPSVLIGRKGTIDEPQFVECAFWTIDTLFFTEIKDGYLPKFIFFKFLMINWMSHNEASGVPSLGASRIQSIEVQMPEYNEQTAIASILSDMDEEITALESRREKTKALKQGMMQELLTGRIRLVEPEVQEEEGTGEFEDSLRGILESDRKPVRLPFVDGEPQALPTGEIHLYQKTILESAVRSTRNHTWRFHPQDAVRRCLGMVLRHEIVHAVTHLGRFEDGGRWPFERMASEVHETLAEFFKDQPVRNPWRGPLDPEGIQPDWLTYWHDRQRSLPANNPYRQHLPLRDAETPADKVVAQLITPYRAEGLVPSEPNGQAGFDHELLQQFCDPDTKMKFPKEGQLLGFVDLKATGLPELLGFDSTAQNLVPVKLFDHRPKEVKLPGLRESVPINTHNLQELLRLLEYGILEEKFLVAEEEEVYEEPRILEAILDESPLVRRLLEVIEGDNNWLLGTLLQRHWSLEMIWEFGREFAHLLRVDRQQFIEIVETLRGQGIKLIWSSMIKEWRKASGPQKQMAEWMDEIEDILDEVNKLLRRYRTKGDFDVIPAMEALGAYVPKPGKMREPLTGRIRLVEPELMAQEGGSR